MNPIELGKAISAYGVPIITGVLLMLIIYLMKYFMKEQSKTNKGILSMFQIELKALHKDGKTNARLNRKSIRMIGTLSEYLNKYFNGSAEKINFRKKVNKDDGRKK